MPRNQNAGSALHRVTELVCHDDIGGPLVLADSARQSRGSRLL